MDQRCVYSLIIAHETRSRAYAARLLPASLAELLEFAVYGA
ncbi:hypothetical protein [Paenibacillus sp. JSM ZJ436]